MSEREATAGMKRLASGALAVVLVTGCTVEGELAEESKGQLRECTDLRDGEVFRFSTDAISNIRHGIGAPTTFDVVTQDGRKKTLSGDMVDFMKCEEVRDG